MKIQNKKTGIAVLILVTIEQVIKVVINNNLLDKKFPILPPLLYFKPMFNRDYSWFNSMDSYFNSSNYEYINISVL